MNEMNVAPTCDLQWDRVLLIIDANHNFTAVQTRVAGTESFQSEASIVSVLIVTWQRYTPLEGLLHLGGGVKNG